MNAPSTVYKARPTGQFSTRLNLGILSRLAAADNLSLWLANACTGADEGYTEPLPLGTSIEFNQAQSFILNKDDGNVYNLYGGGGCAQYVGQVSLGGTCQDVGDAATAIMNIGPQDTHPSVDGSSVELNKRTSVPPNGATIQKRVEGDSSSATDTEMFGDEDTHIRNDFDSALHAAYQNPSGQITVSSFTPLSGDINDVQVTLTMQQGVIQDIQDQDIDSLMSSLNDFRGGQSSPINFLVSLYTGLKMRSVYLGMGRRTKTDSRNRWLQSAEVLKSVLCQWHLHWKSEARVGFGLLDED
ncbi:hypothetical protein B0H13DRAFT_1882723 [Mycena leptocephala]|nr:hypothetical protein B0H13DRAFT_1882723 [Mycena leptocephala]